MNFYDFKEKYNNLIYAPINLDIPKVDIDQIVKWGIDNQEKVIYEPYVESRKLFAPGQHIYSKDEWLNRNSNKFWQTYYIRAHSKWLANFDTEFPQLKKFFKSLPLVSLGACGYLYQNPSLSDVDASPAHTDEAEGLGIRLTIGEDTSGLYFHKLKPGVDPKEAKGKYVIYEGQYDPLNDYGHLKIKDRQFVINEKYLDAEKVFVNHPRKTAQLFLLTNDLAPHAVVRKNCKRLTFAFFGKTKYEERFKWKELDELISHSKQHYSQNFIYA